jgi:hypothetical protein
MSTNADFLTEKGVEMKKMFLLLIAAMSIFAAQARAGGGGLTGGATEITQLMNNAELVMQVSESMQTTVNTLQTAHSTMQMLRSLPQHLISQISGVPLEQVRQMAQAYEVMKGAQDAYKDAADVLKKAATDSQRLGITPRELLAYKADAAYRHGGIYSKVHEEEQEKIRRASQASKDVQRQAETVKSIDSNVKGLQTLASQNLSLQAVLGDISTSISRANQIAAEESRLDKEQSKRELDETQRRLTELDRISESYKPDNRIKLPAEHSKPKK